LLRGINFASLTLTVDGDTVRQENITGWKQTLNMKNASLVTSFLYRENVEFEYVTYALRGHPWSGLIDVRVKALSEQVRISVSGEIQTPDEFKPQHSTFRILKDNEIVMPLLQTVASSPFGRHTVAATATFLFKHDFPEMNHIQSGPRLHSVSFSREIGKGEEYTFAWTGAVCSTADFRDPQSESERFVIYTMRGNKETVLNKHNELWNGLWQGDIIVEGDPESQQDIRLALYHLYSFSRDDSDLSIPPMGLSSQIYNGHIFWDTELWMFPPLLLFDQGIARSLLNYRFDRLDKARQKAISFGYKGAMFPWESDDTGEEATPTWALTGTFQHHITADVGIAFWNYFRVTGDLHWLREIGFPVIREIADFWVSRSSKNPDGSYSIKNVVGANEFAPNVDDNAFTNGSAITILDYAVAAAGILGTEPAPEWEVVSGNLVFNYFETGVMKENSRYNGERIKQADVNLLAYPLEIVTGEAAIRRDLEYYAPRMAEEGPAMGHSILSVISARLGDREKAFEYFKKSYVPNKRPPFGSLAEAAVFNNTYFATGAGGMLQAVIFGFAGLQITDQGILQVSPCLPNQWKSLEIKGVGPDRKNYRVSH
jgi:protein-glucosylgalactosylhydroxylysine glucosidase